MQTPTLESPAGELLKPTTARCPVCAAQCPGEVWRTGGGKVPARVVMRRTCRVHGMSESLLSSDARRHDDPRGFWQRRSWGVTLVFGACCIIGLTS